MNHALNWNLRSKTSESIPFAVPHAARHGTDAGTPAGDRERVQRDQTASGCRPSPRPPVRLTAGWGQASAGERCSLPGPGIFYATVVADQRPVQGAVLTVEYQSPDVPWAACLDGAFANDAVLIKVDWQRAQLG